jgi:hypothetical protein
VRESKFMEMRFSLRLAVLFAALCGCTRANPPVSHTAGAAPVNFTGVWAGDAGPNLAALKFGAKIEILEDGGAISGEFFNEDPERPGVYLPTGQIQGTRDGGTLFLMSGRLVDMGDGGTLEPQLLLLTYDGEKLVGLRRLQLPGRPLVNEYLILRR